MDEIHAIMEADERLRGRDYYLLYKIANSPYEEESKTAAIQTINSMISGSKDFEYSWMKQSTEKGKLIDLKKQLSLHKGRRG